MKKKIIICVLLVIITVVVIITNIANIKNDKKYNNAFYNNKVEEITDDEFYIDKIKLGMSINDVKGVLGEPKEISEFVDNDNPKSSYKRMDYEDLIIQFEYSTDKVNYIASSNKNLKNSREISCGDTITEILKNYHSDKSIEVFENTYGTYEFLYGKEDAIKYLDDLDSANKTFAYIYKYNNDINSVMFVNNGKVLEFYLVDNKINMIIIADKYEPW